MKKLPKELELLKRHCVFCNESMMMCCGSWSVKVSGCCVGCDWKGTKYILVRSAHLDCLLKVKNKHPKSLWLTEEQVKDWLKKVVL